jgi:glycosyltransferase involved in cell wall biosynthesis
VRWSEHDEIDGISIYRTYTYPALHKSFFHRVISFLSFMVSSFWVGLGVKGVDLVWGTSPPIFQGAAAWLLARLKRARFLFEVRDLWPAFAIQVGVLRQPLLIKMSEWLERFLYSHADQVMVNSPGFIDFVTERGARRVTLVSNGADPRMFNPESRGEDFRMVNGLEGKVTALYAGAHGLSNDLDVLLEAALELNQTARQVQILLLGDGKEKMRLMASAVELGLENVSFLPPVVKASMSDALAGADICIAILKPLPLYRTVFPNKVFDYMAAGKPVVLAIDGVIREVIEQAGCGIAVPPGNVQALAGAIHTLANDPVARQEMGARGRKYVEEHFDRAVLAGQLIDVLRST